MDEQDNTTTAEDTGPDLSHLIADAEALEGAEIAAQAQTEAKAAESTIEANRAGLRDALGMARMIASPAFQWWDDFGNCWSDNQLDAISDAGAQVMQRHNITMGELFTQYGPYIALIGATLPPGLATYTAIKARKAELQRPPQNQGQRVITPPPAPAPAGADGRQL